MEAKLQLSSGFLCVFLHIKSAPLSSTQHYNQYFSWHGKAVLVCCFSVIFYVSIYVCIYLSVNISFSLSIYFSCPSLCLVFGPSILLSFSPIPFYFVPLHKHTDTHKHTQNTAVRFRQLGWFVAGYLVLSLMLKSDKPGDILTCSTGQLVTLQIPPASNRNIAYLESCAWY